MTRKDAEQHGAVWKLAMQLVDTHMVEARHQELESLTAALLAMSYLAQSVSSAYGTLGRTIHD